MDKVTSNYAVPMNFSASSAPSIRGHHSSINKAVSAHRQMVEDRTNRQSYRKMEADTPNVSYSQEGASLNPSTTDTVVSDDVDYMEHEMIDPAGGPSKLAMVQAFQSSEPDRPVVGEPIPRGSYLDVEA
jgi:hypothetical protein